MKFGLAIPIFANPGVPFFRTPNWEQVDWPSVVEAVREAETLNYDSLWVADHMFLGRDGAILENWTVLCALSAITSKMRLGTIHLGNGFRHAPLTAKMVATLDFISNGRVELFIDPGWRAREHVAYGFDWNPDRRARVAQLDEALKIMKEMWKQEPVTHRGEHYQLEGAICAPGPVQPGGPRIWMGEALDDPSLDLIAREADVWNSVPASPKVLAGKIVRLNEACQRNGRDPASLVKTLETQVLIYDHKSEADRLFEHFADLKQQYPSGDAMSDVMAFFKEINPDLESYGPLDFYDEFVIGTAEEVTTKLREYQALDIQEVICWFMDFPNLTSLRRMASDVMPKLHG
jgi:alkanesulfonate monooxygenase SsuD/methylene tetrahydromethanopterin reductase-like flavin-dependent oxidoreductase (luciferase family)